MYEAQWSHRALAGRAVLWPWAKHYPRSASLHGRVSANLMLGITLRRTSIPSVATEFGDKRQSAFLIPPVCCPSLDLIPQYHSILGTRTC